MCFGVEGSQSDTAIRSARNVNSSTMPWSEWELEEVDAVQAFGDGERARRPSLRQQSRWIRYRSPSTPEDPADSFNMSPLTRRAVDYLALEHIPLEDSPKPLILALKPSWRLSLPWPNVPSGPPRSLPSLLDSASVSSSWLHSPVSLDDRCHV